jgi:energy-converting hydrogenase A subunit M
MTEPAASERQGCEDCTEFIQTIHDLRNLYGFHGPDVEARERGRLLRERDEARAELARLREVLAIIRDERPSRAFDAKHIREQVQALASITLGGALASGRGEGE